VAQFEIRIAMNPPHRLVGDATTLNDSQLVPRQSGTGWALRVFQQKTEDWVYVPIPDFVEAELRRLKFKGKQDGCNYWFWTCEGALDTATTNWRERVSRLLLMAQERRPFCISRRRIPFDIPDF